MKHLIPIILFFTLASCAPQTNYYKYYLPAMDTMYEIIIYSTNSRETCDRVIDRAQIMLSNMELKYSVNVTNSLLHRLNINKITTLDKSAHTIFASAIQYASKTKGAFDPTVKPLLTLWGFAGNKFRVPSTNEITTLLTSVGYSKVIISSNKISIPQNGAIDLGGMLKGTAVDQLVCLMKSNHIEGGIVNASGNLKPFGKKRGNNRWFIGIRHPRPTDRDTVYSGVFLSSGQAIATSGDYQRYFVRGNTRYHHILSPRTGRPTKNGVISASVVHPSAESADAYSTALFVMGVRDGLAFAERENLPVMYITLNRKILSMTNSSAWRKLLK